MEKSHRQQDYPPKESENQTASAEDSDNTKSRLCYSSDGFLFALSFLTLIPVSQSQHRDLGLLARSLHFFPLVGLLIGAISTAVGLGAYYLFGSPLHAVLVISASTIVSAGFHLDGLADTCDALFSWRSREEKLRIMKDSRIGTMGALALILVLFTKIAALISLGPNWWVAALLAPMFGRVANIYGVICFSPAKEEGLAHSVRDKISSRSLLLAALFSVACGSVFLGIQAVILLALLLGISHLLANSMTKSLGGLTGDTYGLLSEIAETTSLLYLVAIFS